MKTMMLAILLLVFPSVVWASGDKHKPPPTTQTVVVEKKDHAWDKVLAVAIVAGLGYVIYQEQQKKVVVAPRADGGATVQFSYRH